MPPPKNDRVPNFGEFRGGKSWTLPIFGGGQFGTLLDSGTFGGGKKDQTPCKSPYRSCLSNLIPARYDHDHRFNGFFMEAFPNQI